MTYMPNFGMNPAAAADQLTKLSQNPFAVMWRTAFFDLPLALLSQSLRISARGLEAELEYFHNVHNCKTMPEMVVAQSAFIQKATGDIGEEASRFLGEMGAKIRNEAA